MKTIQHYLIIDDDPINNIICESLLKVTFDGVNVKAFTSPEAGLKYIEEEYSSGFTTTVLFLDINMPTLTGWDFMKRFDGFSNAIKKQFIVHILSSSVDQQDKDRAKANPAIKGFITKPLPKETLIAIASNE